MKFTLRPHHADSLCLMIYASSATAVLRD